jgi:hypothetical protein
MKKGEHRPDKVRFWRRHIRRYESSGLQQKEYCAKHGLRSKSFQYWKPILARLEASNPRPPAAPSDSIGQSPLIPFAVVPDPPAVPGPDDQPAAGIRLRAAGYTIDLAVGFHVATLRSLLEALG